ncbi:ribonuclease D [Aquihabitans sp. G128]|uniref:ribonuclease D n=1 Tax=Aquihabitans sp. G128 TaxID=2849779 RepID=UPI001C2270D2|nr:ribonuclease D [Aquihabitans sp. G128]QXC62066.1 ribonuclease D [Aquihabitans sp. G128]
MSRGTDDRPQAELPEARWVDTDAGLAEIVAELVEQPAFGVDTEFHREKTYYPQLALVQLSWNDERALVDPLAISLEPFAAALTSPATVVMHAASQDLEVLHRACGVLPRDLFDTQLAASFVGHSLPALSALVDRFYGVHLPKGDRLTDWLRRPLNEDQRTYAASDVEFLLGLQAKLTAELEERGRLQWALDECEALRQKGQVIRDPEDAWLRIKEARSLRGETAAVAQALAAWRERRAAELDQPVRFVLSDLAIVGIAQRRPKTAADLGRIRGVDERHAKGKIGEAVLAAVAEGREQEPPKASGPSHELDRKLRPAVALVAAWVSQLSRDLEIETSMVATRNDIEALLAGAPGARLTKGWRAELVGERIRRLVEGEAALAFDGKGNLLLEDRAKPSD